MSKYSLFICDKCDFTYEHVDRIFYLNEDLTEITEDTLRIMTSREKARNSFMNMTSQTTPVINQ